MKTQYIILGIITAVVIAGGFFFLNGQAKKDSPAQNTASVQGEQTDDSVMMGVGYIIKDGKMMVEENHSFSPMTEDVTLNDGTIVTAAGTVTKKDGSSFILTEGQSMWTDGSFMEAEEMMEDESTMTSDDSALSTRYSDYSSEELSKATVNNGRAVLFFAALAWCPSCQAADRDFRANFSKVPEDVSILKVDYDKDSAMKQKYAITMQDTFIQVDSQGKEVTRWNSGGQGVKALLANLK